MNINRLIIWLVLLPSCYLITPSVEAGIDKIYHPYVEYKEREIEFRSNYSHDSNDNLDSLSNSRIAFAYSFTERLMLETYLIAEKKPTGSYDLKAYEIEAKWQLTEQGEFWADWGVLFELEKHHKESIWESSVGILWEKEINRWSLTNNIFASYEYGRDVKSEWETKLSSQLRYRSSSSFEPGIELYRSENTFGLGPVFMGLKRFGINKLKWEAGIILGLDGDTADETLRFLIEYEF